VNARRRRWRKGLAATGIAVFGTLIALWLSKTAPRSHTYRFPADPDTGIAVSFDYPDGLVIDDGRNSRHLPASFEPDMVVTLSSRSIPAISRWWFETLLRRKLPVQGGDTISVEVTARADFGSQGRSLAEASRKSRGILYLEGFPAPVDETRHAGAKAVQPMAMGQHGMLIYPRAGGYRRPQEVLLTCTASEATYPEFGKSFESIWSNVHVTGMR